MPYRFDHDPAKERELPTEEEVERALEVFDDPNHIYYEAAADVVGAILPPKADGHADFEADTVGSESETLGGRV